MSLSLLPVCRVVRLLVGAFVAGPFLHAAAIAQPVPFSIGEATAAAGSTTCAPPRDGASRKGLADLQRGIVPPNVHNALLAKALLDLRVGLSESDETHLARAVEELGQRPNDPSMRHAALLATLGLANLRRDLAGFTDARQDLLQHVQSGGRSVRSAPLDTRWTLVDAMRQEADGLGGEAGRALLRQAVAEIDDVLLLARKTESGAALHDLERARHLLIAQQAFVDADARRLRQQVAELRDAVNDEASPAERLAGLQALSKVLYDLASLVRGEEGLEAAGEMQRLLDQQAELVARSPARGVGLAESASRALETGRIQWQIHGLEGDRPCLQRATLLRHRAMQDILAQSLSTDAGRPDAARLSAAIDAMQQARQALSLQPRPMQPNSMELVLGIGYRLQAAASTTATERAARIDQAAAQFDASERRLAQCFCRWQEEELGRERAALDRLRATF